MKRARSVLLLSLALAVAKPSPVFAQQVFSGDPVDSFTGIPYPVMPGVALLLPGGDEKFGTGDDVIDGNIIGDVDLVVRSGNVVAMAIPAPALAPLATVVAGGGSTGQGTEADFTVMVSDGAGAYGNVLTGTDMDLRPVTVYAFADLDGDGTIGPTNADGSADNALELQEVTSYAGRQMGAFASGRFHDSIGMEIAAPASMAGLTVALMAGAWTGTDANALFTDGPFILTRWPFFPPLDPKDLLGGGDAPPPDPALPNELEWDIEANYLPQPGHPLLGTPFAVPTGGSEPTTDQLRVQSATARAARVFAEPEPAKFLARSRSRLRVAPLAGGGGRALVMPVDRAMLAADGAASQLSLRVLPVDLFGNVADPAAPVAVTLQLSGPASIVSPDTDGNPGTETLSLASAAGVSIVVDDAAAGTGDARLQLAIGGSPVQTVTLPIGAAADSDGDGAADDGNASALAGDRPCDESATSCDDNCPRVKNPSQMDSNHDGIGDCCDGTCLDPLFPFCDECALPGPAPEPLASVKLGVRLGGGADADKLSVKLSFALPPGASFSPDQETVTLVALQAGHSGYSAILGSLFTDLLETNPSFRYLDKTGSIHGVVKAQIKGDASGNYRVKLAARGISIADLSGGPAQLTLAIGDDLFRATLECTGSSPRFRCTLAP